MWILKARDLFHPPWTNRKSEMALLSPFQAILSSALGPWPWKDTCWLIPKNLHRRGTLTISKNKFKRSNKKRVSCFSCGGLSWTFIKPPNIFCQEQNGNAVYMVKLHILPKQTQMIHCIPWKNFLFQNLQPSMWKLSVVKVWRQLLFFIFINQKKDSKLKGPQHMFWENLCIFCLMFPINCANNGLFTQ